jgi:tRNA threonylcarbamoyladenosine biosynthesis protein TsaE
MEKVSLKQLPAFANTVLAAIGALAPAQRATFIALEGELGSGKTTFTQALARVLGVVESLQSPTYVLMKIYPTTHSVFATLVHIDTYRLESPEEFAALKSEKFLNSPRTLVLIEWPEKVGGVLPKPDMTIRFSSDRAGAEERYIEVI